jgi:septal ring factor EnvC (AmiA/AmiB activator)
MQKKTFATTTKLQSGTKQCQFILFIVCWASLSVPLVLRAQTPETLDKLSEQWLSIEQQSRQLNRQWIVNQPLLSQRIQLLEAELAQLNMVITESQSEGDEVQDERKSLLAEQNELEQSQMRKTPVLGKIEQVLVKLSEQLPPPVAVVWKDIEYSRLNRNAQAPSTQIDNTADLKEILQRLSSLNEFNQRVTLNKSTILVTANEGNPASLAKQQKLAVTQLYLGSSYAWFVSEDGSKTGYGNAQQGQWLWQIDNSLRSADIKQAIAIYNNKQLPDYVQLPVSLSPQLLLKASETQATRRQQAKL